MEKEGIHQLARRSPEAINSFVDEYGPRINALIFDIVGNRHDAEELTSNVIVKAIEAISSFDPSRSSLSTWLYRIAHNEAVSFLRRPRLATCELPETADFEEDSTPDDPRIDILQDALAKLSAEDRTLIHLYYYDDIPIAEIAAIVGSREGTVAVRLHRLRLKIKKLIENEG